MAFRNDSSKPLVSYFRAPISNTKPSGLMSLGVVHDMISNLFYHKQTMKLRAYKNIEAARKYKETHFDFVTFSGIFSMRNNASLEKHSGYMVFDIDHVENLAELREILINDPCFATQLLFISPSGKGLKWVIQANMGNIPHRNYFSVVATYLRLTYNLKVDPAGRNVSRVTFLCYDPDAYINPLYALEDAEDTMLQFKWQILYKMLDERLRCLEVEDASKP